CIVMTALWRNNARIALRKLLKTGVAITLTETLVAVAATMHAADFAGVTQRQLLAEQGVELHALITQLHCIDDWRSVVRHEFLNLTAGNHGLMHHHTDGFAT